MKKRFLIAAIVALFIFLQGLSLLAGQVGDLENSRTGNKTKAVLKFRKVLETKTSSPRAEMARKQLALLEKSR